MKLKLFLLAFMVLSISQADAQKRFIQAGVLSVHDGDGCKVITPDGVKLTIRFTGIDAPEIISNVIAKDQPGGRAAGDSLRSWIKGKLILLDTVTIKGPNQRDKYDRLLADVYFADSTSVTAKLVGSGLVWHLPEVKRTDRKMASVTLNLMAYAKKQKLGIWAKDKPKAIQPKTWRKKFSFR